MSYSPSGHRYLYKFPTLALKNCEPQRAIFRGEGTGVRGNSSAIRVGSAFTKHVTK